MVFGQNYFSCLFSDGTSVTTILNCNEIEDDFICIYRCVKFENENYATVDFQKTDTIITCHRKCNFSQILCICGHSIQS